MNKLIVFLATEVLLLHSLVSATQTKTPGDGSEIPQNWCFCIHPGFLTPPGLFPYFRSFPNVFPEECSKMEYTSTGKEPVGEFYTCEDLGKCWQIVAPFLEKKKKLKKNLSEQRKMLDNCRKPVPGISPQMQLNLETSCRLSRDFEIQSLTMRIKMNDSTLRFLLNMCLARASKMSFSSAKLQLRSSNRGERIKAALFLARISTTTEVIPVLIEAIGRGDETGCDAISALGNYGPSADVSVQVLASLGIENSVCPGSATITLERIGTPNALAALKLLRRWERKWSLREKRLFRALSDRDPAIRGNAAREFYNIALDLKPTKEEQRKASLPASTMSRYALEITGKNSAKLLEINTALKPLLRDPQKTVRYRAASYLARIDTTTVEAIPVLIEAVKDDKVPDFACVAIAALRGYGKSADAAVPALTTPGLIKKFGCLRFPNPCLPVVTLWKIGTPAAYGAITSLNKMMNREWRENKKRLLKMLADKNPNIRAGAVHELCSIAIKSSGDKKKEIHTTLKRLLRDTDKMVRYEAASCLITLNLITLDISTEAIPVLIEAVKDTTGKYLYNAAADLGIYDPAAGEAVPTLVKLMNEKGYSYFRLQPASEYATALEQIGTPEAIAALKPLRKRELLATALLSPFAFLIFIPGMAPLTCLFFVWLFWWSRAQSRKGRNLVHWPLLISILGWVYIAYVVMFQMNKYGFHGQDLGEITCLWLSIITTPAGLVPWFISWLLLRLRERH